MMRLPRPLQNRTLLAAAALLVVLVAIWLVFIRDAGDEPQRTRSPRPNIVVIQTDDQYRDTVTRDFVARDGSRHPIMPQTVNGILRQGVEFTDYYASTPVCSPSRASLLTGQYSSNNGLRRNDGSRGGWSGWQRLPTWRHNVPVTLQRAGYRTLHVGKLMNGNWDPDNGGVDVTVPPGWNRWYTVAYLRGAQYYGYRVNDDGRAIGPFGVPDYSIGTPTVPRHGVDPATCRAPQPRAPDGQPCHYQTDFTTRAAMREIRQSAKRSGRPFYLQVDYEAPHGDDRPPVGPTPPTRYAHTATRTPLPPNPAVTEADLTDKPIEIRNAAGGPLDSRELKQLAGRYRAHVETVRGIDDGVGAILRTLKATGQLDNTYVFFLSDQGEFLGEHRFLEGKFLAYEASSRVPLGVRGPGVPKGARAGEVVGNIDVPATVLDLAGAKPDYRVDGRSLEPFWRDPERRTRRPFQISYYGWDETADTVGNGSARKDRPKTEPATLLELKPGQSHGRAPTLPYRGFRVGPYKYVRYESGSEELYNLDDDPSELDNRIDDRRYGTVAAYMRRHFRQATDCRGAGCRQNLPPWPTPGS